MQMTTTMTHPSGLFTYTESTCDKQGQHYTGAVLLKNIPENGQAGMKIDWVTEIGGLLIGWVGRKVVFDYFLPVKIHSCFARNKKRHD